MKHVIYFHGFLSSPRTNKVERLKTQYNVFAPELPNKYFPEYIAGQVLKYLKDHTVTGDTVLFVGTSLGGYWAAEMAYQFDGKSVLFNPTVDPAQDLLKYVGHCTNYSTGEMFDLSLKDVESFPPLDKRVNENVAYAVISNQDKVVDSVKSELFFRSNSISLATDDHRFVDLDLFMDFVDAGFCTIRYDNACEGDF